MSHWGGLAECWVISLWPRSLCFYYTHKICVSPHFRNGFDEPCTFQRPISGLRLPGPLAGRPQSPDPGFESVPRRRVHTEENTRAGRASFSAGFSVNTSAGSLKFQCKQGAGRVPWEHKSVLKEEGHRTASDF